LTEGLPRIADGLSIAHAANSGIITRMERYRIRPDSAVYFLTYSVVEWLPVFIDDAAYGIVTESLAFCHREKNLRVNAFVIMPTHMHLIALRRDVRCDAARLHAGRLSQIHRPAPGGSMRKEVVGGVHGSAANASDGRSRAAILATFAPSGGA
jgi:hypothetical protein